MYSYYGTMFGAYLYYLIGAIIIIVIIRAVINRNKDVVTLALTQFKIDSEADDQVVIEGRKTGFIQWLLVQLKLGNLYKIHVKKNYISYSAESLNGEELVLTPVQKVASTSCGFKRPIFWLILAAIFILLGLISLGGSTKAMFLLYIVIALIFVGLYYLGKKFFISIQTVGGHSFELAFKKGLLENIPINLSYAKQAIEHINKLVLEANQLTLNSI